ncbi:MAG: amidohydrolase/deacetylase family metallohydrolase [Bacteroidia bacterium]|nr:amidohydrolase/deacetylase family metallohydrolase [Bacteroidia bacterium]
MRKLLLTTLWVLAGMAYLNAQDYDLLLKGGHIIDPKNQISQKMDLAILDGKVAKLAENIPVSSAKKVIDASDLYVVPGVLDIHSHNFWGTKDDAYLADSYTALPPDGFSFRAGVTTLVDVGGAGWRNFKTFKKQTIDKSKTRVLSFLNIVGSGMAGGATEQNLVDMSAKLTAMEAKAFPDHIVGVKVAHYYGPEWTPVERAVEAGRQAGIPVMVDFGGTDPPHSIETLFMEKLRPGDIFTHAFAHVKGREPIVDENGKLKPFVVEAQKNGIIFDVGHGGGSFLWAQAIPASKQGFKPNSISTDLHTGSMNTGMKDMSNVMSKFLNLGMSLEEVIERSTWNPAQIIQKEELGHLSEGVGADIAVFRLVKGDFGFIDTQGYKMKGDQKLICELTLRDGQIVWDLNGIAAPETTAK